MKRTTMFLDESLERSLKHYAEQQDRSVASVVREALTTWIEAQQAVPRGRPAFVSIGRSGRSDTAEQHESLVFTALAPHTASPEPPGDAAATRRQRAVARRRRPRR